MRIVIALGGNALLRRGQPMTAENQRANIRLAAERIAEVAHGNEVVIAHGNGPQVGLLALQAAAYHDVAPYPLDVLGAQTEAMIGYVIEQELGNLLPPEQQLATVLTMIEVDRGDPAFGHPTKPIGPVYDWETAERLKATSGWVIAADGDKFRRVVASPKPKRIFEIGPICSLVDHGTIVICAGGGGIPTMYDEHGHLRGVEAVIDKDLAAALLAEQLDADLLVIATDVDSVANGETKVVSAVNGVAGNVGSSVTGAHGSVTINGDGTYTYVIDNSDAAVQALRLPAQTLTDSFTYTVQDAAGLTSSMLRKKPAKSLSKQFRRSTTT